MLKTARFPLVVLALFAIPLYAAENWPNFRGPVFNGVSPDGNPPVKWSETENIKWKIQLTGDGSDSSPIIWQDRIFFQSAVPVSVDTQPAGRRRKPSGEYKFNVVCLDRLTGKTLWEKTVLQTVPHEGHHGDHGFASFTPITDGKLLWTNFGSRGVYCLDLDGNVKWGKDLGKKTTRAGFGEGDSPAMAGDNLIVLWDHEGESFLYALNKLTGQITWKTPRQEKSAWTTPLVVEVNGKQQIIVTGHKSSIGYDAQTGGMVWQCSGGHTENVVPTPVENKDLVFLASGFRGAMLQAVKLGRTGNLTGTDAVAWEVREGTPYVPSPILYDNKIYLCSNNDPVISCYNAATGSAFYVKQELEEIKGIYASSVGAAGRIYFVGRNGVTYVLKNSDQLEVVSINKLDDGIDCTPAIYGNELYLKGKKNFYCIATKQ